LDTFELKSTKIRPKNANGKQNNPGPAAKGNCPKKTIFIFETRKALNG